MKKNWCIGVLICLVIGLLTACGDTQPDNELTIMTATPGGPTPVPVVTEASSESETGYPAPANGNSSNSAYPAATMEGVLADLPEAELDLPEAGVDFGVVGGVLASEITGQGYLPITPQSLTLGVVLTFEETGQPAYIRSGDDGIKAELLPTGVFIFRNVPPGEYGLVMDLGFGTFPVENDEGVFLFTVEPGQALDLGTVLTIFPGDGNE
jgi:hypothetical protein